jgi:hypothetical protein
VAVSKDEKEENVGSVLGDTPSALLGTRETNGRI